MSCYYNLMGSECAKFHIKYIVSVMKLTREASYTTYTSPSAWGLSSLW